MNEIIEQAAKMIAEEEKQRLTPWEQAVVNSCEKVAEAINPQDKKIIEATEEEAKSLIKNMW